MKWVLLVALWTSDGARNENYVYSDQQTCERTATAVALNIEADVQVLEIWCYPVAGE
mgnify:CR=1 FL=1